MKKIAFFILTFVSICSFSQEVREKFDTTTGKIGLYNNRTQQWVISPRYNNASYLGSYNGYHYYKVQTQDNLWGIICNKNFSHYIVSPQLTGCYLGNANHSGFAEVPIVRVDKNGNFGLFGLTPTKAYILFPLKYQNVIITNMNVTLVNWENKSYTYNLNDIKKQYNERIQADKEKEERQRQEALIKAQKEEKEKELASFTLYAQKYVEAFINEWQKKGEFEKTSDWQQRVNETTRQQKIDSLIKDISKKFLAEYKLYHSTSFTLGSYDADHEVYLVTTDMGEQLLVPVPIAEASYIKQNWADHKADSEYGLQGEKVFVTSVTFTMPNDKTYTYKPNQKLSYSAPNIQYNFTPIEIPEIQTVTMGGGAAQVAQVPQGITELVVTTPFDLTPMSSVLVSYKNIFGKYEMPDKDETFPYVVIRVTLTGDSKLVRLAKQSLALDLGQAYITEQTVPIEDKILFLVPIGVKSVYLTDGNGQRQLIYSGRLIPNTIYDGVIKVQ